MNVLSQTLSIEQFLEISAQHPDKRYELIHGEIFEVPSPRPLHGLIAARILYFLMAYVMQTDRGYAVGDSNDFVLSGEDIFQPDAAYISKERLPHLPERFQLAPDLAVEIVSPSNTASEMQYKVETYIRYGSKLVWVVYPEQKSVYVYRPEGDGSLNLRKLTGEEHLEGGTVLPGFSVATSSIFPTIEQE